VPTDFGELGPADHDEAEERLGRAQAVVLKWVAHVPVRRDERRHGVEHLERLARVGYQLVRKVADFDPRLEETLSASFGCRLDGEGRSVATSVGTGKTGSGGWEEDGLVEVVSMVLRARLSRSR